MEAKEKTAVEWFFDKIKSHFEHDGDLLESLIFTMSIAKQKEREQMIDFHINVMKEGLINEGEMEWTDSYKPKIKEVASKYYDKTYNALTNEELTLKD